MGGPASFSTLYFQSAPIDPQHLASTSISADEIVQEEKFRLLIKIDDVNRNHHTAYKERVTSIISYLKKQIERMQVSRIDPWEIKLKTKEIVNALEGTLQEFYINKPYYAGQKELLQDKVHLFDKEIAESHLEFPSFSDDLNMDEKKAQLSQCIWMAADPESPFGAEPCLAHHSKGLSKEEKKELEKEAPNMLAGRALSALAAAPAAIAESVNAVAKVFVLGAMAEGIAYTDPANFHERVEEASRAFNGENPQFNQLMNELTPEPAKSVGRVIQRGVDYAARVDQYTQERFYTVPGIVQMGIIGTVDIGIGLATGPILKWTGGLIRTSARSSGRIYQALKASIRTFQNELGMLKSVETVRANHFHRIIGFEAANPSLYILPAMRHPLTLVKGGIGSEAGLCFHELNTALLNFAKEQPLPQIRPRMIFYVQQFVDQLALHIPDLTEFVMPSIHSGSRLTPHMTLLQKATGRKVSEISSIAINGFGDEFFRTLAGSHKLVIVETDMQKGVSTFVALNYFRALNLKRAAVPKITSIGKYRERYLLAMSDIGEPLASIIENNQKSFRELYEIFHKAGKAYGELHSKNAVILPPGHPLHEEFVKKILDEFEMVKNRFLAGEIKTNPDHFLGSPSEILNQHPVIMGMTHGDAHLGNITWNSQTKKIGFIDLEFFLNTLTIDRQPCRYPVIEYAGLIDNITSQGFRFGEKRKQIYVLKKAFMSGYKKQYLGDHPAVEELVAKLQFIQH